jgi:glycerol kinase
MLFSQEGIVLGTHQKELNIAYPEKGWVEQDANDIWQDTLWACAEILKEDQAKNIVAIGITNQRETTVIWDRKTGEPIYNAIVWQDRRTAEYCAELKKAGHEDLVRGKTGLLLDPYFSATKIKWVLDNVKDARKRAEQGELAFGTIDSFLIWRLTNGQSHATDVTNASRTMLYNIVDQKWDETLLELFDIPASLLPEVKDNCADFGIAKIADQDIPITGVAGDQQAALFGQACFEKGMVKSTYGTGCFALMNIGSDFKESQNRLLTTVAYRLNGEITYAIEGAIFVAGAAIQWLRDNLEFFEESEESEALATSVPDNNDVYFVPAFTGLGAPHWEPNARAMISGLSRETTKAHITRAALEAQAYQTHDLMNAFAQDSGQDTKTIRVDGGLVANNFMCQFLSDILNVTVEVPEVTETTALGAAYLAGLHVDLYAGLDDISSAWNVAKTYKPQMDSTKREELLHRWDQEIQRVLYK